jgi:hypothetical protein
MPKKKQFRKVRKNKRGTPLKYLSGVKNKRATEKEIKRTAKLYKAGKLTPAMMNAISKRRAASAKKKKKKKR